MKKWSWTKNSGNRSFTKIIMGTFYKDNYGKRKVPIFIEGYNGHKLGPFLRRPFCWLNYKVKTIKVGFRENIVFIIYMRNLMMSGNRQYLWCVLLIGSIFQGVDTSPWRVKKWVKLGNFFINKRQTWSLEFLRGCKCCSLQFHFVIS